MLVDLTEENVDGAVAMLERVLLRWALDEYRAQRQFERSVCADDATPMTDLGGEAGA